MKTSGGTTTKFGQVLRRVYLGRAVFLCPCAGCHVIEEELTQLLLHLHFKHSPETPEISSKVLPEPAHDRRSKLGSRVATIVCSHKETDLPGSRVNCPAPSCPLKTSGTGQRKGRLESEERRFSCPVCTYSITSLEKLGEHLETHSDEMEGSKAEIELNPRRLYSTVSSTDGKSLRHCAVCPQTESSKEGIEAHVRKHGAVAEFSCSECNFRDDVEFLVSGVHKSVHSEQRVLKPYSLSSEGVMWVTLSDKSQFDANSPKGNSNRGSPRISLSPNRESFEVAENQQQPGTQRYECDSPGCDFVGLSVHALNGHSAVHSPRMQAHRQQMLTNRTTKPRPPRQRRSKKTASSKKSDDEEVNKPTEVSDCPDANPKLKPTVEVRTNPVGDSAKDRSPLDSSDEPSDDEPVGRLTRSRSRGLSLCASSSHTGNSSLDVPRKGIPEETKEPATSSAATQSLGTFPGPLPETSLRYAFFYPRRSPVSPLTENAFDRVLSRAQSEIAASNERQATPEDLRVFVLKKIALSTQQSPEQKESSSTCSSQKSPEPEEMEVDVRPEITNVGTEDEVPVEAPKEPLPKSTAKITRSNEELVASSSVQIKLLVMAGNYVPKWSIEAEVTKGEESDEILQKPSGKSTAKKSISARGRGRPRIRSENPVEMIPSEVPVQKAPTPELTLETEDDTVEGPRTPSTTEKSLPSHTPPKTPVPRRRRACTEGRSSGRAKNASRFQYGCSHPGCRFVGLSSVALGGHMNAHRPKTSDASRGVSEVKPRKGREFSQTPGAIRARMCRARSHTPISALMGEEDSVATGEYMAQPKVVPFVADEENLEGVEETLAQMRVADRLRFRRVGEGTMVGCPYCPYEGKVIAEVMTDHMAFHGADYKFRCESCNYATTTLETLQLHQLVHDEEAEMEEVREFIEDAENGLAGEIPADVLSKAPKKWSPLALVTVLYMETSENGKLFGCPICPMRSPYHSITMEHYVRHFIEIGDFNCALCHLRMETCAGLYHHTEDHLKKPSYGIRNDSKKLLVTRAEMDRVFFKVGLALGVFKKPTPIPVEPPQEPTSLNEPLVEEFVPVEDQDQKTATDDLVIYEVHVKTLPEVATATDGDVMFQCGSCGCLKTSGGGLRRKHLACHGSNREFTCQFCNYSSSRGAHVTRHEREDHGPLAKLSVIRLSLWYPVVQAATKCPSQTEASPKLKAPLVKIVLQEPLLSTSAQPSNLVFSRKDYGRTMTPRKKRKSEEPDVSASSSPATSVSPEPPRNRSRSKTQAKKRKPSGGYVEQPGGGNRYVYEWQIPDAVTGVHMTYTFMCLGCRFESKSRDEMYLDHMPNHIKKGKFHCQLCINRTTCTFSTDDEKVFRFHTDNHHGPKVTK